MVDQLLQIEIGPDVALGGHRHRYVLQMIGQGEQLRAIAPGNKAGEGLAELMRREAPWLSAVPAHVVEGRELADAVIDVHVGDANHLAVLRVTRQEKFVAARGHAQRFAHALQHFSCSDNRVRGQPTFEPPTLFGGLEQAPDHVSLADSGRAELAILDRTSADREDLARPHTDKAGDHNEAGIGKVLEAAIEIILGSNAPPGRHWESRASLPQ